MSSPVVGINRYLSAPITSWLGRMKFTPNQVTMLSLLMGLLAGVGFFWACPKGWILGGVAFQLAYLLDNCDGDLARMTGQVSGFGSWLDTISDCMIHCAFFLGLGGGLLRVQGKTIWLTLGAVLAGLVVLTYLASFLEQLQLRGRLAWEHPDASPEEKTQGFWRKVRYLLREDFSVVVLISSLLGRMGWILWAGVVGASLYLGSFLFSITLANKRARAHEVS